MFETVFHSAFINCLRSPGNIHVMLTETRDLASGSHDIMMRTECPHYSVSLFELDAADFTMTEEFIAEQMMYRIRNLTSNKPVEPERTAISNIYFAAGILQDSILVIQNADKLDNELYRNLEKVEKALSHSGKGRLRILLVGSQHCIPRLALSSSDFSAIKWLNILAEPDAANHMIEEGRFAGQLKQSKHASEEKGKRFIYFGSLVSKH